jgi:hypothetical protein
MDDMASTVSPEAIGAGALALLERHFAAINSGDRDGFRDTACLFEYVDGEPFERWWRGMRSLAPLLSTLTLRYVRERVSTGKEPHIAAWVHVQAGSRATGRTYADDFVVWYLLGSRTWKLGCRGHWY